MKSERWIIHVHERPAAVERVLGTLRRRAIHVSDLSVARASGSSLVVNVAVRVAGPSAHGSRRSWKRAPTPSGWRGPETTSPREASRRTVMEPITERARNENMNQMEEMTDE